MDKNNKKTQTKRVEASNKLHYSFDLINLQRIISLSLCPTPQSISHNHNLI